MQHPDQAVHHRSGLPVIVAQEDGKTTDPFDKRRHVGLFELLAKLDEIAFPMPELFALGDGVCPLENVDIRGETPAMAAPGVPWPASGTMLRQMSPEFDRMTVG